MSRRQNAAAQKLAAEQILYAQQCQFWSRSLERNDADMAAVMDLNRSLHAVRSAFVKPNNNSTDDDSDNDEILLLDLGLGRYRLAPDGRDILLKATEVDDDDDDQAAAHNENQDPPKNDAKDVEVPQHTATSKSSATIPHHHPLHSTKKKKKVILECIPESELSVEKQELCVDFLLRKKLRRKLLSRIARRLNRLASSMDGDAAAVVSPPPGAPPKYGDLRLHCDAQAVEAFAQLKQRQDEAWTRIQAVREAEYLRAWTSATTTTTTTTTTTPKWSSSSPPPTTTTRDDWEEKQVDDDDKEEEKEDATTNVKKETDATVKDKIGETLNVVTEETNVVETSEPNLTATEEIPTMVTNESDYMVTEVLPSSSSSLAKDTCVPPDIAPSSSTYPSKADAMDSELNNTMDDDDEEDESHDPLAADYALLRDYKDAYEKVVDFLAVTDEHSPATTTAAAAPVAVQYTILQQPHVEDYVAIKLGTGGIGATHQSMSAKEKELEFLRWQSSLLARIPEQPTYAELGLEHRVFNEAERRQRALQKIKERREKAAELQAMKSAEHADESSSEEEDSDDDTVSKEETAPTKDQPSDDDESNSGSDEDIAEVETPTEVIKSITSESGDDDASTKDIDREGIHQATDSLAEKQVEAMPVSEEHNPAENDPNSLKSAAVVNENEEEVAESLSKPDDIDGNIKCTVVPSVDDQPFHSEQMSGITVEDDWVMVDTTAPGVDERTETDEKNQPKSSETDIDVDVSDVAAEMGVVYSDNDGVTGGDMDVSDNAAETEVVHSDNDGIQLPETKDTIGTKDNSESNKKTKNPAKDPKENIDLTDPGVGEQTETEENDQLNQSGTGGDMDVSDDAAEKELVHSDNDGIQLPETKDTIGTKDNSESNKKTKNPAKDPKENIDLTDPGVGERTETEENNQLNQSGTGGDMDVSDDAAEKEVVHSDNDGIQLPETKDTIGTKDNSESNKKTKSPSKDQKQSTAESKKDSDAVEEKQVENEAPPVAPKILKPMSLTAIPSFYEQDMKRIKLVHADLMSSSMREHAVRRLEEATRDYNLALKNSSELVEHRTYLQNHINALSFDVRNQMQSVNTDYAEQVAIATNRWKTSRLQFENNRLNRMLPSRNGRIPIGTQTTLNYKIRPNRSGICEVVGNCLADIVDCVDGIAQGLIRSDRFTEPFTLPPQLTGVEADTLQRNKQLETTKRNELNAITLRLRTSEGDRLRAWRKMLKTKAEFDIPHHHQSSNGTVRVMQLDQNTCSTMPLPTLHQSATQRVPNEFAAGRSFVASYTPTHVAPSLPVNLTTADSKYSTDRVRDRIAADGSVAPVTKPKMTKDGLYQRPAGRTRKGMEWDAVRGIWIPAPESKSEDRES